MTEPATAATPAAAPAPGSQSTIMELLTADTPAAAAQPASAARPEPKGFVDPLDDERFADAKLATPDGIRAARDLLQAELKAARDIRVKARNGHAELERKTKQFKVEKSEFLTEREAVRGEKAMIAAHVKGLRGGDVKQFIAAVGALSGAEDPHGFWMDAAVELAQGKALEKRAGVVDEELRKEVEALKADRAAEREAQAKHLEQSTERQLFDLRVQQVKDATTFTDLRHVSALASDIEHVPLIDARLVAIKEEHFAKHGKPIDTRAACGILEAEIQSHFELLQRAGNPSGAMNGEREAAASVAGQGRLPGREIAKPEPAPGAPAQNRSASAIPASLSAVAATTTRARTKAEKDQATIAGLEALGVFANFGMR